MQYGRRYFADGPGTVGPPEGVQAPEDSPARPMQFYSFDANYVQRLADRDRSTEEHFVAYFSKLLSIKLRGRVRSPDAMKDIQQDTFERVFKVLRQKEGLQHPERLGAFVNSVCNNVMFEKLRQELRYQQLNQEADNWPDSRVNLDAPLINQERKLLVESVLAKLPPRDQELLRMIFLEETDKAEACRRLGVSQDYLRVLLHRAITRFRGKLDGRGPLPGFVYRGYDMLVKRSRNGAHHKVRYSNGT